MLKISTEIKSTSRFVGERKAIELIAEAGFDAWDFSMFSMINYDWKTRVATLTDHPIAGPDAYKFARELRDIGESNGIVCNQSHAPHPTYCKAIADCYEKCIELTAEAGGKICIIHPDNYKPAEENAEIFNRLLPVAKGCGVKIATENKWNRCEETKSAAPAACSDPKSFLDHLNAVNDEYLVACLDIGHSEMLGLDTSAPEMIDALGAHLQALHIHDNDKKGDRHAIPFSMSIDYDAVAKALKRINYSGYLTLEAVNHLYNYGPGNLIVGVKELADSAKKLAMMIENA